jgi:hypothetical protein
MAAKFYQTPWSAQFTLNNGHSTTLQTIATLTAITRINQIIVTSTDTAAREIQLVATIGSNDQILGTFNIPLRSGDTTAAFPVLLLKSASWDLNNDISNNKVLDLPSGAVIKVKAVTTAVTSTKFINFLLTGEQDIA